MNPHFIVCMVCTTGLVLYCTAANAAENPMACVEEITMPRVTPGMVTSLPANIEVHVLIGSNGVAQKVDYSSGTPALRRELDFYFKDGTSYSKACNGRTIRFTVRYLVEGNKTQGPVSEVRFRPPDEFIIRSHPVIPAVDPFPEPRPK